MRTKSTFLRRAIAVVLMASFPGMAVAQQRPERPGQNLDETMIALTEQLELDVEQAGQIRVLLAAQNEQSRKMIEEARASGQGRAAFGAMRERMGEMREGTDARIKHILSAEQMARYEELVTKREQNRPQRGGQGGRPPPG